MSQQRDYLAAGAKRVLPRVRSRRRPRTPAPPATGNENEPAPASFSQAILELLWPRRKSLLGLALLIGIIAAGGLYMLVPESLRGPMLQGAYGKAAYYFLPRTTLAVVVPDNLGMLDMSVADFDGAIRARSGISDTVNVASGSSSEMRPKAILTSAVETVPQGVKVSVHLADGVKQPIGDITGVIPNEYVADAGKFFFDSLLRNLDVSWGTFSPYQSPHRDNPAHRDNPIAFALLEAAQAGAIPDSAAVRLLNEAIKLEPDFATGYWALGNKLMRMGDSGGAAQAFDTARKLNPDVAEFGYSDPKEAIAESLGKTNWAEIDRGMSYLKVVQPEDGVIISAWRIDPSGFSIKVIKPENEYGSGLDWLRKQPGVVLAFNGGQFEKEPTGRLHASGLLIIDGIKVNNAWAEAAGGVLAVSNENRLRILPTRELSPSMVGVRYAVQANPVMIESGGKWAMRTNDHYKQNRTAACLTRDGKLIVVIVTGTSGLSLYELAELLMPGASRGIFDCDSAIALDGGPSTQGYSSPNDVEIPGGWNIHDAVVIARQ